MTDVVDLAEALNVNAVTACVVGLLSTERERQDIVIVIYFLYCAAVAAAAATVLLLLSCSSCRVRLDAGSARRGERFPKRRAQWARYPAINT
jgi:hypothetical protein